MVNSRHFACLNAGNITIQLRDTVEFACGGLSVNITRFVCTTLLAKDNADLPTDTQFCVHKITVLNFSPAPGRIFTVSNLKRLNNLRLATRFFHSTRALVGLLCYNNLIAYPFSTEVLSMNCDKCLSIITELIQMSKRKAEFGHSVFAMIVRFKESGGTVSACKSREAGRFVRLEHDGKYTNLSLKINDKPERYEFGIVESYPDLTTDSRVLNIIKKQTESYYLSSRTNGLPHRSKKRKLKR